MEPEKTSDLSVGDNKKTQTVEHSSRELEQVLLLNYVLWKWPVGGSRCILC